MRLAHLLSAVSSVALTASGAHAQAAGGSTPTGGAAVATQPETKAPNEIVVTGTRSALENAETVKRRSPILVDGISADDIGALPDVSMAQALVRVPGLVANNSVLGFDQVSVRGLGPDLTQIQYNGRILPTPSPSNRRVSASVLPTEGIGGAYVQKTSEGSTIEGGTAGTVDLESIHPLETKRHGLTLVGRATSDDLVSKADGEYGIKPVGFRGEATYVARPTDRLGVAISYAYLRQSNLQPSTYFDTWKTNPPSATGKRSDLNGDGIPDAIPANAASQIDYVNLRRHSVIGMVQWKPTDSLKISLDGLAVLSNLGLGPLIYRAQGAGVASYPAPTSSTVENNTVTQFDGQVTSYRNTFFTQLWKQRQYEGGLNVAFDDGGPAVFALDAEFARATQRTTTAVATVDALSGTTVPFGYDVRDQDHVTLDFQPFGPDQRAVSGLSTSEAYGTDTIKALRADFKLRTRIPGIASIGIGAKVDGRDKNYSAYATNYTLPNKITLDGSYLADSRNPFQSISQYLGGDSAASYPLFDIRKLMQLVNAPGVKGAESVLADIGNYSRINETTFALYGQANIDAGPLTGNAGVRWFNTDETVRGLTPLTQNGVLTAKPVRVPNHYNFFLPALNLRYAITSKLSIRFGANKSLSRPVFNNLRVGTAVDVANVAPGATFTVAVGNPYLKPFTSKNIDLSAEWYPDRATSLAVEGYYKWVTNFTVTNSSQSTITLPGGQTATQILTSTTNDPAVRHFRGIEIIARRDFNFLPGLLSNLGMTINYNHNLTNAKSTIQPFNGVSVRISPNGFVRDVVNTQLYYSTKKLDVRLAYRYYSAYNRDISLAYQKTPGGQLDLSGSFEIWRNIRFTGYITNLTKSHDIRYYPDYRDPRNQLLLDQNLYSGRSITGGIRATF